MMRLTDTKVKALRPRNAPFVRSDGDGLWLTITPTGSKIWRSYYELENGVASNVRLGKYPATSLQRARTKNADIQRQVADGINPKAEQEKKKMTVKLFADIYYTDQLEPNYKNPIPPQGYLNQIAARFKDRSLSDITREDVYDLVKDKKREGKVASALHLLQIAKSFFDYAVEESQIDINPAAQIKKKSIGSLKSRTRTLSRDEIAIILNTLYASNVNHQLRTAYHLLLLTMVRKNELMHAHWKDINLLSREWIIPEGNSKNGHSHVVYLSTQAVELFQYLKQLSGDSDLVIPGRSGKRPFGENSLNLMMASISFDVPHFTIHDSRRALSTLLSEMDYPLQVVEKQMAHTLGGVAGIYNRAEYSTQRKEMLQALGDEIDKIWKGSNVVDLRAQA